MDLSDVHSALRGRGFELLTSSPFPIYTGNLSAKGVDIAAKVYIPDRSLVSLPIIQILQRPVNFPKACAHMSSDGFLCYIGKDQAHLPRDNLGAGVLGCLALAEKLIVRTIDNETLIDTQDEFPAYWAGLDILLDLSKDIRPGLHDDICIAELPKINDRNHSIWIMGKGDVDFINRYEPWDAKKLFSEVLLRVVDIKSPLGAIPVDWPPKNLKSLSDWLATIDHAGKNGLLEALKDSFKARRNIIFLLIRATNTSCAVFLDLNLARNIVKTSSPERFMRTVIKRYAKNVEVKRLTPIPTDPESWISRNVTEDVIGLASKNIVLVGCGAIGGFLADLLVKQGAGFLGGSLLLVDNDYLSVGNIGRHYLGFGQIGEVKSHSLKRDLIKKYPAINLASSSTRVKDLVILKQADLIIDATGSPGFSQFLSESKVSHELPPIIFSWVVGTGCGAQAYLMDDEAQACLHCLDFAQPGASLSVMRAGYELKFKHLGSCGEWLVPFSVPAATHAAALAADLALAWARGKPNPTFRSITIDHEQGKLVKPNSPKRRAHCPICSRNHS
ncbi:ThiF family adenylyltransferase [Pseudomonas viridiflava]|uniref:ThiF family adenylyltransferase n=1 Tax=Pseudomonas viridiflava TaxID=33069 RepID=UPI000F022711|nr:ThiF family adenylyltransferase [Pseudomonas viridiflava]